MENQALPRTLKMNNLRRKRRQLEKHFTDSMTSIPGSEHMSFATPRSRASGPHQGPHFVMPGTVPRGWHQHLWCVLVCCLAISSVQGQANINGQCYRHLREADADQNNFLSQNEFADAVRRITYGAVDSAFTSLPPSLLTAFATRSQGGAGVPIQATQPGSTASRAVLDGLCDSVADGVLDKLGVSVVYNRCYLFMSIGDQNRDNALSKDEFPRYVNPASGNRYGSVPFDSLPLPVQLVFDDFAAASGTINIEGTRPGTTPTADREPVLQSLCRQTLVAVEAGESISTPAPTDPPGDISFTLRYCTAAMAAADRNRNAQMDDGDYARFINTVSQNGYPTRQYDRLPQVLQENFIAFANELGYIDLDGARPGTSRTPEQEATFQAFCDATQVALNEAADILPPTQAPTQCQTKDLQYVQCTLSMATSDSDRSNTLTEEEYVNFLNKVQSFAWRGLAYADIPRPLQANFEALAAESTTPGIDTTGAFPGSPLEPEQKAFLERVCLDTGSAIEAVLCPDTAPSPTPNPGGTPAPGAFSGNLTVFSAFVIAPAASDASFDAIFPDNDSTNSNNLEAAYAALVTKVVGDVMASKSRKRRHLRGLAVNGIVKGSPELYERQTIDCPPNSGKSVCQKVYGRFDLDVQDEAKPDLLRIEVSSAVQTNMNRTEGGLQEYLDQVQPESPIAVVGVPEDGVLRPPTPAPSTSPTQAPDESRSSGGGGGGGGDGGGGMGTGLLIGIIVGGLVLCCCCIYCVYAGEDGPLGSLFDRKPKKKKRTETEGSINQFGDDLPPPGGNDNKSGLGALGMFDGGNGPTGEDDDTTQGGFSIQEQAQSKNRFGFGKKSTENALGPVNGMDGDQDESLADYGFDDATVDQSKAGDDNPSLAGGDWNPQKPPTAGTTDPWSDRRRASPSTESEESDDDGTGYGDSDSESESGSGSEDEEDVYREDTRGRYDDGDGEGDSYGDDYDDDYDDNYDDNTNFGDEQTMESETFRGEDNDSSIKFNTSAGGLGTQEFDNMVDKGNWSGIMRNADGEMDVDATFGNAQTNNASFGDSGGGLEFGGPDSPSRRSERSHSQSNGSRGSGPPKSPARSRSSDESQKQDYLERVRELVSQVVPDEVDNVPAMMEQFAGREEELINTLQTMYERSTSTRARKAVHRSKGIPDESGRFTAGSADGTAAVAAASTIGQGFDSFTDGSQSQSRTDSYMDNGSYADGGSYAGQSYEQGSYRDDSYGEGSYRDNSYGEGSYTEGEGSFRDDYHDDDYGEEGSYSRGSYDDGGSYRSGSRGSQGSYSRGSQGSYSRGSQGSYSRGSQGSYSRGSQGSYSRGEGSYRDDGHFDDGGGDYDDDYDDDYDQQHQDFDASFGGHRDFDDEDEGSFADEYD